MFAPDLWPYRLKTPIPETSDFDFVGVEGTVCSASFSSVGSSRPQSLARATPAARDVDPPRRRDGGHAMAGFAWERVWGCTIWGGAVWWSREWPDPTRR